MIQLRPIYAIAAFQRPDLEGETGVIGFAVQEAMREVCRRTFLARASMDVTIAALTSPTSITMPAGKTLLKIHRVNFLETGSTDDPKTITRVNLQRVIDQTDEGFPLVFAQSGSKLYLCPASTIGGTATIEYSYVPNVEVDEIDLPELAFDAIKALAESMILARPDKTAGQSVGPDGREYASRGNQSLERARAREREYHACLGDLRTISEFGEGGEVVMATAPFPGAP